jgi:HTH-type transcriptional regulator / antitoxin HigA
MSQISPTPYQATHPGVLLADEIKVRGISQKELASNLGVLPSFLNEILKGKRSITADFAILLENILDIPADYWMRFQSNYDIDKARIKERNVKKLEQIKNWKLIENNVPVSQLRLCGYFGDKVAENIELAKKLYRVDNIDGISSQVSEQNSIYSSPANNSITVLAWYRVAEYEALKLNVNSFDIIKIAELKKEIEVLSLTLEHTNETFINLLAKYGVKLVFMPKFVDCNIEKYVFWSENNPAIALQKTDRYGEEFIKLLNNSILEIDCNNF